MLVGQQRCRRAPGSPELDPVPSAHAARVVEQLAQRDTQRGLVLAGAGDVTGQRIQREARRFLGAHRSEPLDAVENDRRHTGDRLDVVDHRRAAVEPGDGGERRPQSRLPAPALQRIEQCGSSPQMYAPAPACTTTPGRAGGDIAAQEAGSVGLGHRVLQSAQYWQYFAAHVDERVARPDRVGGNDDAFDEYVRCRQHQRDVFARTRFGLVGVDYR